MVYPFADGEQSWLGQSASGHHDAGFEESEAVDAIAQFAGELHQRTLLGGGCHAVLASCTAPRVLLLLLSWSDEAET